MGTSDLFRTATPKSDVADRKREKSAENGHCGGVADRKGGNSENERVCAYCGRSGGNQTALDDGASLYLHPACEAPWIDRRMGEEGLRSPVSPPSTPLDYHGPVVAVPDMGPDPLGEHGEAVTEAEAASGLGGTRHCELAASCGRWMADEGLNPADVIDALRNTIREEVDAGVDVEREVAAVMAIVRKQ
jgi:hypothetical protein